MPGADNALLRETIIGAMRAFMESPANDLHMPTGPERAFEMPLFGVAAGDDPIWEAYKTHVGDFHWTPADAFALAHPKERVSPAELRVIVWILPQTAQTRKDQRTAARAPEKDRLPSRRWAHSRVIGEVDVNEGLRHRLVEFLRGEGIQAIAPALLPEWRRVTSDRFTFASFWSERHAAYAAGLGTFGLCDGLITPAGKAIRVGSVIARCALAPDARPYAAPREYCLYFSSGACGKCIDRCPAGALSFERHDKRRCEAFVKSPKVMGRLKEAWGLDGYACGLCQVGVPCEAGIPLEPK